DDLQEAAGALRRWHRENVTPSYSSCGTAFPVRHTYGEPSASRAAAHRSRSSDRHDGRQRLHQVPALPCTWSPADECHSSETGRCLHDGTACTWDRDILPC